MNVVNHVGLRVRDLEASTRFYEALGFSEAMAMDVPDDGCRTLLGLDGAIGLRAVYLTCGPFVLELLGFGPEQPARGEERVITDVGLTHLSLTVADIAAAKQVVVDHGGTIVDGSDVGVAVMVRDPNGQLIEFLAEGLRPVTPDA